MWAKTEVKSSGMSLLDKKYQKFWSESDSDFVNAKRLLENYLSREALTWAPSMFQRVGKNRTTAHLDVVKHVLDNHKTSSVLDLVNNINDKITNYSLDSSLFNRLQYICEKTHIPYSISAEDNKSSLVMGSNHLDLSEKELPGIQPLSTTASLAEQLLSSYKKYHLLEGYKDLATIRRENRDLESVELINDPKKLDDKILYLYVITEDGDTWFAPQKIGYTKLTHGALLRAALKIPENEETPPVLASGAIMKSGKEVFINLASGHFEPEVNAYGPALESLAEKLPEYLLYAQMGYSNTHYKSLDLRYAVRVDPQLVKQSKGFREALLGYIQQASNLPGRDVATKIFRNINSAGSDVSEENIDKVELNKAFEDNNLRALLTQYVKFCPDEVRKYVFKEALLNYAKQDSNSTIQNITKAILLEINPGESKDKITTFDEAELERAFEEKSFLELIKKFVEFCPEPVKDYIESSSNKSSFVLT